MYDLTKEDVSFTYILLDNLDEVQYIKINGNKISYGKYVSETTVNTYDPYLDMKYNQGETQAYWGESYTVKGQFEKELGYIFVDDIILENNCTDEDIKQIEKQEIEAQLRLIKHQLNFDIKNKKKEIEKLKNEINKKEQRLKWLNKN